MKTSRKRLFKRFGLHATDGCLRFISFSTLKSETYNSHAKKPQHVARGTWHVVTHSTCWHDWNGESHSGCSPLNRFDLSLNRKAIAENFWKSLVVSCFYWRTNNYLPVVFSVNAPAFGKNVLFLFGEPVVEFTRRCHVYIVDELINGFVFSYTFLNLMKTWSVSFDFVRRHSLFNWATVLHIFSGVNFPLLHFARRSSLIKKLFSLTLILDPLAPVSVWFQVSVINLKKTSALI